MKKIILINSKVLFVLTIFLLASCSKEEVPMDNNHRQNTQGRFDNSPFIWDQSNSKRPTDDIYIADLNISLVRDDGSLTKSEASKDSSGNLFIYTPVNIYAGAAYPKSSFPSGFDKEIGWERNPIDIVYDFNDPFLYSITKETGSSGYKKSLKSAINSNEYQKHLSRDKADLEYYFTRYYTYSDLEKAFPQNISLGRVFSANTASRSKDFNIQSRVLVKLASVNFSVYMDAPGASKGFFKDASFNKKDGFNDGNMPVYVRSLTYGNVAYVAIESECAYSEVERALKTAVKNKFKDESMKTDQQVAKVFGKSSVTIFAISTDCTKPFFADDLSNLGTLFAANYSSTSYGYPIYLQGKYVYDNSSYCLTDPTLKHNRHQ